MLWKLQSANSGSQKPSDWVPILINAAPLILLVGFCLLLMRQMQKKGSGWNRGDPRTSRTGIGYDLHRLEAGRKLIVGGIELPFDKGPAGHSDGDVLAHAMCDALLGAAGLGDNGGPFPAPRSNSWGAKNKSFP